MLSQTTVSLEKTATSFFLPLSASERTIVGNTYRNFCMSYHWTDENFEKDHGGGAEMQTLCWIQTSWSLKKDQMHIQVLDFSVNQFSSESKKSYYFSLEHVSSFEICRLILWWKNATSRSSTKTVIGRSSIQIHSRTLTTKGHQNILNKFFFWLSIYMFTS